MNIREFRDLLEGVTGGDERFMACCPHHTDHPSHPSLSVWVDDKRKIAYACKSRGCRHDDILNALDLKESDLYQDNDFQVSINRTKAKRKETSSPQTKIETETIISPNGKGDEKYPFYWVKNYLYTDEAYRVLFKVVRMEDGHGKKEFPVFRRHIRNEDEWRPGLGDKDDEGSRVFPVPYLLPKLLRGIDEGQTVFVVEGEKDVETLESLSFVATTMPGCACGSDDWLRVAELYFKGASVIIISDNDKKGREKARTAAKALARFANDVRLLDLTRKHNLEEHEDVTDFLDEGVGTIDDLMAIIREDAIPFDGTDERSFRFGKPEHLLDILSRKVPPWWYAGIVGPGDVGYIVGAASSYKTFNALDLSFSLIQKSSWGLLPFSGDTTIDYHVAYCCGEGNARFPERIKAVLYARGLQTEEQISSISKSFSLWQKVPLLTVAEVPNSLRLFVDDVQSSREPIPNLLVLDTQQRAIVGMNENDTKDMSIAQEAVTWASRELKGCTIILLAHMNVNGRPRGSTVNYASADFVMKMEATGVLQGKMSCEKSKDGEIWDAREFHLVPIHETSSVAFKWDAIVVGSSSTSVVTSKTGEPQLAVQVLDILGEDEYLTSDEITRRVHERAREKGWKERSSISNALTVLKQAKQIATEKRMTTGDEPRLADHYFRARAS